MKKIVFILILGVINNCYAQLPSKVIGINGGIVPTYNQATLDSIIAIPSLASNIFNNSATAKVYSSIIYNTLSDYTGEPLTYKKVTLYADSTTMTDANVDGVFIRKIATGINTGYYQLTKSTLNVKDFGAYGDGVHDDRATLQNAINICILWGRTLYVPAGNYLSSGRLSLNSYTAFRTRSQKTGLPFAPQIIGDGMASTEIYFTSLTDTIGFDLNGGSGASCIGSISRLQISGDVNTTTLIHNNGRGGFTCREVSFLNAKRCIQLHNTAGIFTEFNVFKDCTFSNNQTALELYTAAGGDNSFHGDGIDGGLADLIYPGGMIKIINGFCYNAPLNIDIFPEDDTSHGSGKKYVIQLINSNANNNFHGHISIEKRTLNFSLQDGNFPAYFQGHVSSYNNVDYGRLFITDYIAASTGGTPSSLAPHARTDSFSIAAGGGVSRPFQVSNGNQGSGGFQIVVNVVDSASKILSYNALYYFSDTQIAGAPNSFMLTNINQNLSTTYGANYLHPQLVEECCGTFHIVVKNKDGTNYPNLMKCTVQFLPLTDAGTSQSPNIYSAH